MNNGNRNPRRIQMPEMELLAVPVDPTFIGAMETDRDISDDSISLVNKLEEQQQMQVDEKIQYILEQCADLWGRLDNSFQQDILDTRLKTIKHPDYAQQCIDFSVEQITVMRNLVAPENGEQPRLIPTQLKNCTEEHLAKAILNSNDQDRQFLLRVYTSMVEFYKLTGRWYWCYYYCCVVMKMFQPYPESIRMMYISSLISIASFRHKKIQETKSRSEKKRFIRLAVKFLDLAEMENILTEDEEQKLKFTRQIKTVRTRCSVYQVGTVTVNNQELMVPENHNLHEPLPFVWSNALQMGNLNMYYTMAAKKNFKVGETVFFERPFVFLPKYVLHYCGYCSRRLDFQFVPCLECNEVVYCDFECRAMAIDHNQTCGYEYRIASLLSVECHQVYHLLARQKQEEIDNIVNEVSQNPFRTNLSSSFPAIQLSATLTGRVYVTRFQDPTIENTVVTQSIQVALILINKCTKFIAFRDNLAKLSKCVYYLLLNHYVSPFTGTRLKLCEKDNLDVYYNINAYGMFGYRLRHSCKPNIIRRYKRCGYIIYIAQENINMGDVLTINYGVKRSLSVFNRAVFLSSYFDVYFCNCSKCHKELMSSSGNSSNQLEQMEKSVNELKKSMIINEKKLYEYQKIIIESNFTFVQAKYHMKILKRELRSSYDVVEFDKTLIKNKIKSLQTIISAYEKKEDALRAREDLKAKMAQCRQNNEIINNLINMELQNDPQDERQRQQPEQPQQQQ